MPEEPTDEDAKTLSRRLAENLRKEQRAEAQSRKTRRMTIPTVTEIMEIGKEDGTRQSAEDTGGALGSYYQPVRRRLQKKQNPYGQSSIEFRPAEQIVKDLESTFNMTHHVQEYEKISVMDFPYLETKRIGILSREYLNATSPIS